MKKCKLEIICGFLSSGKTTYIQNKIQKKSDEKVGVIAFEKGLKSYITEHVHYFEYLDLESIYNLSYLYDKIFIEYNGTWDVQEILSSKLYQYYNLENVVMCVDHNKLAMQLSTMSNFLLPQLLNANYIVTNDVAKTKLITKNIGQSFCIVDFNEEQKTKFDYRYGWFLLAFGILLFNFPNKQQYIRVFVALCIEIFPFLLIGVIFSALIQLYLNSNWLVSLINKKKIYSYPLTILFSGFLPICDCASAPIMISLVEKQASFSHAITFLLASSSINPVVIFACGYAFNWRYDIILWRIFLSIVIAIIGGILLAKIINPLSVIKKDVRFHCLSYIDHYPKDKFKKMTFFFRFVSNELFEGLFYVVIACGIASFVQVYFKNYIIDNQITNAFLICLFVVVTSIFLSICASSNAFIAKTFTTIIPLPAAILFMVLGPMLDIKNIILLSKGFKMKFIAIYMLIIIMLTVFLLYGLQGVIQ